MSRKKHARERIDNSLTDLVAAVQIAATGGSALSSYNTVGFSNNYALITLNRIILTYLFSGNGIFQTAIQLPIQDALSKGIEIESGELSAEDIDQIYDWFEKNNVWQKLEDYRTWVRVYGGGALIINSNQDPEKPLNYRRIQDSNIELYDVDRWQLSVVLDRTPNDLDYDDMTKSEYLYLNGQRIHTSRCIIGVGKRAPYYIRRQLRGWGMSEAERMLRDLNNYLKTGDVLYEILDESKIDIYKITDLANKLLTTGGTTQIQRRIQAANQIKNYVNALILDAKEEYEQKQMTFSGLAEVMRENRIGIASALRIPLTKLFGLSSTGFSTGESDLDNYNQMVESEIRMKIRPDIRALIQLACGNLFGYVPSFRFKFPNLKVISALDEEEIKSSVVNRYLSIYDRGGIKMKTAMQLIKKEGGSMIDDKDIEAIPDQVQPPNGAESVAPIERAADQIKVKRYAEK